VSDDDAADVEPPAISVVQQIEQVKMNQKKNLMEIRKPLCLDHGTK